MFAFFATSAFLLGAIVGSFLNVVIHRYPREESIVFPGSHCPHCNAPIRWFDNIPLISYLLLGAKCRNCREPIAARYFLVELANALFYLALFIHLGPVVGFLALAAIISITIVLIYIDLDIQILPDVIDLPGIAIGIGIGTLRIGDLHPNLTLSVNLLDSLYGAAFGALLLLALGLAYKLLRQIEGMGLGDVKMLAMIGAVLGWRAVFPVLFIASVAGAAFGVALAARDRRDLQFPIPFGVFLGIATFAVLFFGPTLFSWYR